MGVYRSIYTKNGLYGLISVNAPKSKIYGWTTPKPLEYYDTR